MNWKFWQRPSKTPPPEEVLDNGSDIYTVCETDVAITTHLRLRSDGPLKFGGGLKVKTLCGSRASWDTRLPVSAVRCRSCKKVAAGETL